MISSFRLILVVTSLVVFAAKLILTYSANVQPEISIMLANNYSWDGIGINDCLQVKVNYGSKSIRCCKMWPTGTMRDRAGRNKRATASDLLSSFVGGSTEADIPFEKSYKAISSEGHDVEFRCLPHFIIAGAQKSGTTALSALLASLPLISFHPKKEAHYFDKAETYKKGLFHYLDGFKPWDYAAAYYPPMYGEGSPFYIASRLACGRIAKDIPNAKLVILLREPVARAYSEYQMKKRRVETQNEFIALLNEHSDAVYSCMREFEEKHSFSKVANYSLIKECVPSSLNSHSHFPKFIKSLSTFKSAGKNSLEVCFGRSAATSSIRSRLRSRSKNLRGSTILDRNLNEANQSSDILINITFDQDGYDIDTEEIVDYLSNETDVDEVEYDEQSSERRLELRPPPKIQAAACLERFGKEKLSDMKTAFQEEADFLRDCFSKNAVSSQLQHLDVAIDKCLTIRGGISAQYVYRSIYSIQLFHCFKHINRSNIFISSSERLSQSPKAVLEELLAFLGFPSDHVTNSLTITAQVASNVSHVHSAVQQYFPRFESSTGWSVEGGYEKIDRDLERTLKDFFAPYNKQLFELLGQPPFKEWSK